MADAAPASDAAARRRGRPPLDYARDFQTPTSVQLAVIGVVRSPYVERFGCPRQPVVTEGTLGGRAQQATIELIDDERFTLALRGVAGFSKIWILSYFHLNTGWNPLVRPPRGPCKKQGLLATRSPHHPNPIGLSAVDVEYVDEKNRIIHIRGVDLLDGTAVLDIKPYVPYCDAFPEARSGWLDELKEDMRAPDHLGYWPPPEHITKCLQNAQQGANSKDDTNQLE